jgi:hypothetical protein
VRYRAALLPEGKADRLKTVAPAGEKRRWRRTIKRDAKIQRFGNLAKSIIVFSE